MSLNSSFWMEKKNPKSNFRNTLKCFFLRTRLSGGLWFSEVCRVCILQKEECSCQHWFSTSLNQIKNNLKENVQIDMLLIFVHLKKNFSRWSQDDELYRQGFHCYAIHVFLGSFCFKRILLKHVNQQRPPSCKMTFL